MEIKFVPGGGNISKLQARNKSTSKGEKVENSTKDVPLQRRDSFQASTEYEEFLQTLKGEDEDMDLQDILSEVFKTVEEDVQDLSKSNDLRQEWTSQLEELENAKKSGEEASKAFKDEMDAFRIALLYGSGKAVSPKDLEFLKEKNPKAFAMAIAMRSLQKTVEEDKKKKSIRGEEKEEQGDNGLDAMKDAVQESLEKRKGLEVEGMDMAAMDMAAMDMAEMDMGEMETE